MSALEPALLLDPATCTAEGLDALASRLRPGGDGTIQQLVEALGPQLTATDEVQRDRGCHVLAEVTHRLVDWNALDERALNSLVGFFSDRVSDYMTIGPVLHALRALARAPALPPTAPLTIATSILERCDVRSLVQTQRHAAMQALFELVRLHWQPLTNSGSRLLLSTVHALDGEKDPRNLLLYFQLLRALCAQCEADGAPGLPEVLPQIFDDIVAYFPITFTPPPNDPHQITSQHLLQALLRILKASKHFATQALGFFVGKLSDDAEESEDEAAATRLQVLQSIAILTPAYGAAALAPHASKVGEALGDILGGLSGQSSAYAVTPGPADAALAEAVKETLRALATVLGDAEAVVSAGSLASVSEGHKQPRPSTPFESLAAPAIARCVSAPPAGPGAVIGGRTLSAIYAASVHAGAPLLRQAIPATLRRITAPDARPADRGDALALLLALLRCACDAPVSSPPVAAELASLREMCAFRDGCQTAAVGCIRGDIKHEAEPRLPPDGGHILCLVLGPMAGMMTAVAATAPNDEANSAAEALDALSAALLSARSASVSATHAALVALAAHASLLRARASPTLQAAFDAAVRAPLLTAFAADMASAAQSDHATCAMRLAPILSELVSGSADEWADGIRALVAATEHSVTQLLGSDLSAAGLADACLRSLARILQPVANAEPVVPMPAWLSPLLSWLSDTWRRAAEASAPALPALLEAATPLWSAVASRQWGGGSESSLLVHSLPWLLPEVGSSAAAAAHRALTPLLLAALTHTPRTTTLPVRTLPDVLARCTREGASDGASEEELRCLCVAYNKWADPAQLDEALHASYTRATAGSMPWLSVWHYLGRAAACRGGKWTQIVPAALVGVMISPPQTISPEALPAWLSAAALGIEVLMRPLAPDLVKEHGAQLAPLLAQRLYTAVAPPLRKALEEANAALNDGPPADPGMRIVTMARRESLLESLTRCLVATPTATLLAEPTVSVPYLLQWMQLRVGSLDASARAAAGDGEMEIDEQGTQPAMGSSSLALLMSVLNIACVLIRSLPPSEAEPLGDLVPTLLTLLAAREQLPPAQRVLATEACIECIDAARALPYERLMPHKRRVLRALEAVLDHRKRRVRQAACRCANRWHLLTRGAPAGR